MPSWYLVKLRYQKEQIVSTKGGDEVKVKTITEQYLVDAVSFTDAEAIATREMPDNTPDFNIYAISRQRIADLFHIESGGEIWYSCKVQFRTEDDRGREKFLNHTMYINAEHEKQAIELLGEQLKRILIPSEVVEVKKTKVLDVIPYRQES